MSMPILQLENLKVIYSTTEEPIIPVQNVDWEIQSGEAMGLVGESGSGKSTLAFAIMNYLDPNGRVTNGKVRFQGEDMLQKREKELNEIWGNELTMIYQDPKAALNPSLQIGTQLTEALTTHKNLTKELVKDKCIDQLEQLNLSDPNVVMQRYPHQLSGGQLQRIMIAMALLPDPSLIIMDEPTSSLDVTVEAGILDIVENLIQERNLTALFITHNLGVIGRVSDRLAVMYAGEIVEIGATKDVFHNPLHPYTKALYQCVPKISPEGREESLNSIPGRVETVREAPTKCLFEARCDDAGQRCQSDHPELVNVGDGRFVRCFHAK